MEGVAELHCLILSVGDRRRVVDCSRAPFPVSGPEKEESYWGLPDQQASCTAASKRGGGEKEIARKKEPVVTAQGCAAKVPFADFRGFVGSRTKAVLFHIWNTFGSVGTVFSLSSFAQCWLLEAVKLI